MAAPAEENTSTGTRKVTEAPWPRWFRRRKWNWQVIFQGITAFAIPLSAFALFVSVTQFRQQQAATAKQALDQRRQSILDNYLNDISALVLANKLTSSASAAGVRALAVARTDTAVQSLDGARKGILIRYLWEADLIRGNLPVVYLHKVNLDGAVFRNAYLYGADLSTDYLVRANFTGADPHGANLSWANLSGADLRNANLGCFTVPYRIDYSAGAVAQVGIRSIQCTDLKHAVLNGADLANATLVGANLTGASLGGTDLKRAQYNSGPIACRDADGDFITIPKTQWPPDFSPAAAGAIPVHC